jgi:hypothetical protein
VIFAEIPSFPAHPISMPADDDPKKASQNHIEMALLQNANR